MIENNEREIKNFLFIHKTRVKIKIKLSLSLETIKNNYANLY